MSGHAMETGALMQERRVRNDLNVWSGLFIFEDQDNVDTEQYWPN